MPKLRALGAIDYDDTAGDAAGLSDEQFGEAMVGDALDEATTALLEGVINFLPKSRRPTLLKVLAKAKEIEEATLAEVDRAIDALDVTAMVQAEATIEPAEPTERGN